MTVQIEYLGFEQDDAVSPNNGPTGAEVTHTFTIASGDLLVAFVNRNNTTTSITPPTGWIELKTKAGAETSLYWIGYRIAGSSEPSSWTWDIGENTSWDIAVRHYRTNGSNIQFSDILEDTGTANQTATINTQAVPVNSLSLIHIQTDTTGAYCQSVTGFDSVLPAALTSRTQQTGHFINTDYEKSPATPTVTFDTGSTIFVSNHFYITWTFQKSVRAPAYIRRSWTRQPPAGTPIDWSNPVTRGLSFFAPVDSAGTDILSGEAGKTRATSASSFVLPLDTHSPLGQTYAFTTFDPGAEANDEGWYWGTDEKNDTFPPGFEEKVDGSTGLTTITWAVVNSYSVAWTMFFGLAFNGSPYYQGCIVRNDSSQNIRARATQSDATGEQWDTTTSPLKAVGQLGMYALTMQSTGSGEQFRFYVDGIENASSLQGTGRTLSITGPTNGCGIVANAYDVDGGDRLDGYTTYNAIWNRELSAGEVRSLYNDPWQIFKPRNIYIGKPPKRKVVVY